MKNATTDRRAETIESAKAALVERLKALLTSEGSASGPARLVRVEAEAPDVDPLTWLRSQNTHIKTYWSDREHSFEMAGVGAAVMRTNQGPAGLEALLDTMDAELTSGDGSARYFGGIQFDTEAVAADPWKPFGAYAFLVPEFECFREGDRILLACNVSLPKTGADTQAAVDLLRRLSGMTTESMEPNNELPSVLHREDRPDRAVWTKQVEHLLDAFKSDTLTKVVLARETRFQLEGRIDPLALLSRLKQVTTRSYHYCFQFAPDAAFVGASPERLYKREGTQLLSEALAGTRPRGLSEEEDARFGRELLASKKERWEHRLVVDNIRDVFARVCSANNGADGAELHSLRHCHHLLTSLEGTLKNGVNDAELLRRLHPTAAVGGVPTERAMKVIGDMETFPRGWYTGPVGWIGKDSSEFAVAIRSALVQGTELSVYTGAGIVSGSDPEQEWDELESKGADFQSLLSDSVRPSETAGR